MCMLAVLAIVQSGNAFLQTNQAKSAQATAVSNEHIASTQQAIAVANLLEAEKQTLLARVGLLSEQSNALQDKNFQFSMLLGIEAYKSLENVQSLGALLNTAQGNPRTQPIFEWPFVQSIGGSLQPGWSNVGFGQLR